MSFCTLFVHPMRAAIKIVLGNTMLSSALSLCYIGWYTLKNDFVPINVIIKKPTS